MSKLLSRLGIRLRDISDTGIENLITDLQNEQVRRKNAKLIKVSYYSDVYDLSSPEEFTKGNDHFDPNTDPYCTDFKYWAKVVSRIDKTKSNEEAFVGCWLYTNRHNFVKENDIVIEKFALYIRVYRVISENEKELICYGYESEYPKIIEKISHMLDN